MGGSTKSPNVGREIQAIVRRIPAERCVPAAHENGEPDYPARMAAKTLLTELAARYVAELGGSAPSKAKLLRFTGLSEGGLSLARALLVDVDFITVQRRGTSDAPATTLHQFNRAALEAAADPAPERAKRGEFLSPGPRAQR